MAMPSPSAIPEPAELERLFSSLVDGLISDDDFARLESMLAGNPAVRADYRDFMRSEYLLAWEVAYGAVSTAATAAPAQERLHGSTSRRRHRLWLVPLLAGGLAASLLVMVASSTLSRRLEPPVLLTAEDAATWQAQEPPRLNSSLPSGPLKLIEGSAQVTFPTGAVVAIRAPAEVEVLGRNRLFLRSGRITPFVPPDAKGFTVISPGGEVVDFGTEFSIDVDASGKTDVFVIDGAVDVSGGHGVRREPLRLTQGFASRLSPATAAPLVTLEPLVVDHFDRAGGPLLLRDVDDGESSGIVDGQLRIPMDGSRRPEPIARVALDNDFTPMVGCRSVISFNATLPQDGEGDIANRWMALVLYDGDGDPPKATRPDSIAGVLVSPRFTVAARVRGESIRKKRGFPRAGRGIGPHRVVVEIDDTPGTRGRLGGAGMSITANGLEIIHDQPIELGPVPRLALHTHVDEHCGGRGFALIDDFSVSVETSVP